MTAAPMAIATNGVTTSMRRTGRRRSVSAEGRITDTKCFLKGSHPNSCSSRTIIGRIVRQIVMIHGIGVAVVLMVGVGHPERLSMSVPLESMMQAFVLFQTLDQLLEFLIVLLKQLQPLKKL